MPEHALSFLYSVTLNIIDDKLFGDAYLFTIFVRFENHKVDSPICEKACQASLLSINERSMKKEIPALCI